MFQPGSFCSRSPLRGAITQRGVPATPFRRDDPLRSPTGHAGEWLTGAANAGTHERNMSMHMPMANTFAADHTTATYRTSIIDDRAGTTTPTRQSQAPKPHFSRWTRLRAAFLRSSPAMLQKNAATASARSAPIDRGTAAVLLKTIAKLSDATVHKLPKVNATLSRKERWIQDNIQSVAALLDSLSEQYGYATKSSTSAKRCLYERAESSVRHLKALANDDETVTREVATLEVFRL